MDVKPITLGEASELHETDLNRLYDLRPGSIKNYRSVYRTIGRHLAKILGREPMTTDLTPENIKSYFRDYVAVECPGSYMPKRSHARSIVRWLMDEGRMPWGKNGADAVPARRVTTQTKRTRRLTDNEFVRLLKFAKRSHLRDYFLCLFLRLTGRRIGEVIGGDGSEPLVWADVRWDEGLIEWDNSKGRKLGRTMPLTPRLRAVLEAWKGFYCRELGVSEPHANWYVFPAMTPVGPARKGHSRRRVLSPRNRFTNGNKVIRALLEASGLWEKDGDGWHILRKSFANQRKQAASAADRSDAWDLTRIALDHEDVKTTRLYVNLDEEFERYADWANATPELTDEAMGAIPELAPLVPEPAVSPETPSGVVVDFAARRALRVL